MLYYLLKPFYKQFILFNLFRYMTFRIVMGATTGFVVSWLVCYPLIKYLKARKIVSKIRADVPERHLQKAGTPGMGGIAIVAGILAGTILWARIDSPYVIMALVSLILTSAMGFVDDYLKDKGEKPKGLLAKYKFFGQFVVGIAIAILIYILPPDAAFRSATELPFIKKVYLDLGIGYILFSAIVVVATSNGVNIVDGEDGLAGGLVAILAAMFTAVAYVSGRSDFTSYLNIAFLSKSEELAIFCASMAGACLGFLYHNSFPASIFMGDTGALSLGASLGVISIMLKKELLLFIAGQVIVIDTLTVILQVLYFKFTGGKRLFKIAPIHHALEDNLHEAKIVVRFWILGIIFALFGLVSFKIR